MRPFRELIAIIVFTTALLVGFITVGCQDDWCYFFPWQKAAHFVPPNENAMPFEATLEGLYICLPHKNSSGPQTLECALGIKTDEGIYYALDMSGLMNSGAGIKTATGTRIRVAGTLVPIAAISSDQWQKYDIQGIMHVKTFTIL